MIPQRPDCKFIGRILGPRGISVKQLEAQTDCRILIRGKGSVKVSLSDLISLLFLSSFPSTLPNNSITLRFRLCITIIGADLSISII